MSPRPTIPAPAATTAERFLRFVEIVRALRNPDGGCPWDLEQNHLSLRPYLIEEAYEVLEAIDEGSDKQLADELGDVLLQVVLHAQVADDRKAFTIDQVLEAVSEKMIRRHPHVFGDVSVTGSGEVLRNWEKIKSDERIANAEPEAKKSLLAGVPPAMPALLRAQRLGEKAAKVSFDWSEIVGVRAKVAEELAELDVEIASYVAASERSAARPRVEEELGDLLFSVCQLARWLGVNAEESLRSASGRFVSRFERMESLAERPMSELSSAEMEALWERAKALLSKD